MSHADLTEMWAHKSRNGFGQMGHDIARAIWVGAPIPERPDMQEWMRNGPACCSNRGISGGPSPMWPHAEHVSESRREGETWDQCAMRLAREGGYTIPMLSAVAGDPGWEERNRTSPLKWEGLR